MWCFLFAFIIPLKKCGLKLKFLILLKRLSDPPDLQYSRKVLEQDKKSCFCEFIVSFIEILFTYSR